VVNYQHDLQISGMYDEFTLQATCRWRVSSIKFTTISKSLFVYFYYNSSST